jgi:hypothetical protein
MMHEALSGSTHVPTKSNIYKHTSHTLPTHTASKVYQCPRRKPSLSLYAVKAPMCDTHALIMMPHLMLHSSGVQALHQFPCCFAGPVSCRYVRRAQCLLVLTLSSHVVVHRAALPQQMV